MVEELGAVPSGWTQFGLAGLIFLLGLLAFGRGWVFSRKSVEDMIRVYDGRLEDKNSVIADLKAAVEASDKRNEMLSLQVAKLVELGRTSNAVLTALPGGKAAG